MKWIKKCPVFLLLAVSGLIFTLVGIIGKGSIYKDYEYHFTDTPFLALMMDGFSRGEYPWGNTESGGVPDAVLQMSGGTAGEDVSGTENAKPGAGQEDASGGTKSSEPNRTYEYRTVTEDYFNDAVFIGDSRTQGLLEYGGMEERADFFSKISLTIYDVFTEPVVKDADTGKKITVAEALGKKQYKKVYLMLGINELGTGTTESFMEEYKKVVARLRQLQPEAIIFVEGIMRVTGSKNEADPIFNNTNINDRNMEIARLADNRNIFYIDVNEVVCDGQGNLNDQFTMDEIHLKAQYYEIWKQFLMVHGIVKE